MFCSYILGLMRLNKIFRTICQKTGKTIIKYLKKRKMTGDDLRREMWVHDVAETPKKGKKKKGKGYDVS